MQKKLTKLPRENRKLHVLCGPTLGTRDIRQYFVSFMDSICVSAFQEMNWKTYLNSRGQLFKERGRAGPGDGRKTDLKEGLILFRGFDFSYLNTKNKITVSQVSLPSTEIKFKGLGPSLPAPSDHWPPLLKGAVRRRQNIQVR